MAGKTFTSDEQVRTYLDEFFASKDQKFYDSGIMKLATHNRTNWEGAEKAEKVEREERVETERRESGRSGEREKAER